MHEIHRYVEEGEHDEEVVFPVVITTTGYQDQNITFDNHEHLILLYRTENNSSVRFDFLYTNIYKYSKITYMVCLLSSA